MHANPLRLIAESTMTTLGPSCRKPVPDVIRGKRFDSTESRP
jgi:hypothetical protein